MPFSSLTSSRGIHGVDVGFVLAVHVARILVPRELRAFLVRPLHDELLPEEVGGVTDRGPTDLCHEVVEDELAELRAVLVGEEHKVAAVAPAEVEGVGALPVHLRVLLGDELGAFGPHHLQVLVGDDTGENEEPLLPVLLLVFVGDEGGDLRAHGRLG